MLHYSIKIYLFIPWIFFLFVSREQDKSKAWISKMGMQSSWILFSNILEGQSHFARKSGIIHCCFFLPWSPLSQLQLPCGLLPGALPEGLLMFQLWCQEVGNGRTRCLQVPEKSQLPPFALSHSVPCGNALGDIKFVAPTRGKLRSLDCVIQLIKTGFQRKDILNWHKFTLVNHQQKNNYDGGHTVFSCGAKTRTNTSMELWGEWKSVLPGS